MVDFTLPPTLTDQLQAVNILLASIGEQPVSALDPSESSDADIALSTINEVSRATQSQGWHWNRETALDLIPDSLSMIALPDNCLYLGQAYGVFQGRIAERARHVYDLVNHTFIFTAKVTVDMVLLLSFEEMPEYARRYITIAAAQLFQGRVQTSSGVTSVQAPYLSQALVTLEQREDEAAPRNVLTGNNDMIYKIYGYGVLRRV